MSVTLLIVLIFIIGYTAITLEHTLKIDKLIPALAMMVFMWAFISVGNFNIYIVDEALKSLVPADFNETLLHHFGKTTEILIFLIGAMTIVEIINHFDGFSAIKGFVKTKIIKHWLNYIVLKSFNFILAQPILISEMS